MNLAQSRLLRLKGLEESLNISITNDHTLSLFFEYIRSTIVPPYITLKTLRRESGIPTQDIATTHHLTLDQYNNIEAGEAPITESLFEWVLDEDRIKR